MQYGRRLLDILFTKEKQQGDVISATGSKSKKPELDQERKKKLLGEVAAL